MSIFLTTLQNGLSEMGLEIALEQQLLLEEHWRLVCQANAAFNLTAIADEAEAAEKHVLDCLLLAQQLRPEAADKRLLDIGSGAGYPGLVLAIACPQWQILLLEANQKKARFLADCAQALGLMHVEVVNLRAEAAGREPGLRGQLPLVTARAVAALPVLLEYALPFLQPGGRLIAMKGPNLPEEEAAAQNALALLGGLPCGQSCYRLPRGDVRYLAGYCKQGEIPEKYPRRPGMPEKRPL